jgi:cobalt-zinc-cadmium efflux system protein
MLAILRSLIPVGDYNILIMDHIHTHDSSGDIKIAFFLNLTFTVIEIFGGIWTNSLAILSDAIHDLGDSLSLGMAWYLERVANKEQDQKYSYGYRRFSLLGALVNTIVLIVGSILVLSQAIPRLINPEPTNARGMIIFAFLGILVNGLAVLRLRGRNTLNARVVALHLLEDVLGWVAVLVVSIALLLFPHLYILDPLLSILITVYVLYNVIKNLRKTFALFLQAVPENVNLDEIEQRLLEINRVCSTHHTHVWSMDGEHHVLTTHVVVDDDTGKEEVQCIKEEINQISRELDFVHTTVEIEYGDGNCVMAAG